MKVILENPINMESPLKKNERLEYKKIASHRRTIDGSTIFQYEISSRVLSRAELIDCKTFDLNGSNNPRLHTRKGCVYVEAINEKNAIKRLKRGDFFHHQK